MELLVCIACGAEHGQLETHSAADCARRIRQLKEPVNAAVVAPLRKDWQLFRDAPRKAA